MSEDRVNAANAEKRGTKVSSQARTIKASAEDRTINASSEMRTVSAGKGHGDYPPGQVRAVTLRPSLYADVDIFYSVVISNFGDQALVPSFYEDDDTFYDATVDAGSVDLAPGFYEDDDAFFSALVTNTDDAVLEPSLYADADTFYAATATLGAVTLTPGLYADADTFYSAVVATEGSLTASLFANANTFYQARISDFIVRPSLFENSNAFYAAIVGLPGSPLAVFGQQIDHAWFQEDLPTGEVTTWLSQGRRPRSATQATPANRPTKLAGNGGVHFAKGATKYLQWATDAEAVWSHRWWVVIARAHVNDGTGLAPVVVGHSSATNQGSRQPYVFFNGTGKTLNDAVFDTSSKVLSQTLPGGNAFADWHVHIGYRRGFKHGARIDGVDKGLQDFIAFRINNVSAINTLGSAAAAMSFDMAIDRVYFGDGELTDYQLDVLEGYEHWRLGIQANLPSGHRFKSAPPSTSDFGPGDLHNVFRFNQAAWDAFVATVDPNKYAHRGENNYSEAGYSRIFFTDFDLVDQKPVSDLTGASNSPWFAPGWLTTLGLEATQTQSNGQPWPLAYVQNTGATAGGAGRPGTISLHMYNDGSWKTGSIYSVNHNGYGRSWGKGIFKARVKFTGVPPLASPYPGFFPGPLWSYGTEHLFQRTRNRIEPDFIELTGKSQAWNEASIHIHEPAILYPSDTTIHPTGVSKKVNGYEVKTSVDPDFAADLNVFDGNFHLWTCKIEDDFTYYWVDGEERGRHVTHAAFLEPKYLVANFALDAAHGDRTPAVTEAFDMTFDYVEVMQKTTELAVVPTGFSGLPTISGTTNVGSALTVTPNTVGSQIEYRWYRDGVPIVTPTGSTYVLLAADAGHTIRVHVKNKALINQPEAWSAATAAISNPGGGEFDWPDGTNTGAILGGLTAYSGPMTITTNNTTISNKTITGTILVRANGFTMTNCVVNSGANFWGIDGDAPGINLMTISDCTFNGTGNGGLAAVLGDLNIQRCNVSGYENGIICQDLSTLVKRNYIHDLANTSTGDPHIDGIVVFDGTNDLLVEDNRVASDDTSCIFVKNLNGSVDGCIINHNHFTGADILIRIEGDQSPTFTINGVAITNNVLGPAAFGRIDLEAGPAGSTTPTVSGNVDLDGNPVSS